MNKNIQGDFRICISVPLTIHINIQWLRFLYSTIRIYIQRMTFSFSEL